MGVPIILVDSATGSDSAASGAGPATALTGSAGVSASSVVTLDGSPDLSGVATDGTHVIYFADATAGNRNFSKITAVDNGLKTVTVDVAFTAGTKAWAIGGKRAAVLSATTKKLYDNNGAAGDMAPGWEIQMQSGHVEPTTAGPMNLRRAGDTTTGRCILSGASGTRPILKFSNNGNGIVCNAAFWWIKNFEIRNTSVSKGSTIAIENNTAGTGTNIVFQNIKIADATDKFNKGISAGIEGNIIRDCEIANTNNVGIELAGSAVDIANNYVHDCGSHGMSIGANTGSTRVHQNIFARNAGDGVNSGVTGTNTRRPFYVRNVFDANTGSGIEITASSANWSGYSQMTMIDNQFTNNGDYGLKFSGASITGPLLWAYGLTLLCNNHYANTGGFCNITLTDSQGNTFYEGLTNADPGYTAASSGNFTQSSAHVGKGYPQGLGFNVGVGSSTINNWDIGIQKSE